MVSNKYTLLSRINSPFDLKKLKKEELSILCEELREYIIELTSLNPGHLGSSLGTIELTVAIHYVFDTPNDKLVWDVGHQAYAHKILTGRRDEFVNNRKYQGISGFPKMSESPYDAYGGGHSSISISAILGMAMASQLEGNLERNHVAVIGDGALTGGIAFEGLNHAGSTNTNMLVILNDNGMAIDQNVGALSSYLLRLSTSKAYNRFKTNIWNFLSRNKRWRARNLMQQMQNAIKGSILKGSNLFEAMGFRYFGPVDGHNVVSLVNLLQDIKTIRGAKLLHCITVKGKGLKQAEIDQTLYHAPGLFNKETGEIINIPSCPDTKEKYQIVFGKTICELARKNPKIVGITPAMASGCSLDIMMKEFPERTFDVGIAEQHAVSFAAGMAAEGYVPFCNIYSTFLQRSYDQIIHDVAIQNLHVIFCIDRAGLVGEDGVTHHGVFDLAYLRCIPNMIISAPINELDLRNLMYTAVQTPSPFAIRYPRGKGVQNGWKNKAFELIPIGKAKQIKQGEKMAVLSIGHIGNQALKAAEWADEQANINTAVFDMRFLKPLDEEILHFVCQNYQYIISIENGTVIGGLGSAIAEFILQHNYKVTFKRMGIPDKFVEQGNIEELHHECGIDTDKIKETILQLIRNH
ncbi:MAG: 1-deoxy-D-xylulose-5-phosphate synthase [Bacteroidales bacterium]|jgi:1-deoxy-D-xylulose-5-phosphate synthase|nr:1-deoxy-D-xylulose-5-phosphate synthase [Bacteroidales bacterium]MDD2686966.1 1-deoxy-D-xylulose-5-phosphate synthase [Bacteroidales bacterium]MDD3330111.1 1-deoxy-D-xylulose-5-phosphate synthase [Bacteroidales bacterium]MDD3690878.1 1-deoxy-D-xylulose-5-phosphate synthase [Bacteroidales bacterium]MDD4044678.1 1-deoxy-D-xylulose-5-phosphate synthase [Bacteroidales bacterium]